jgi:membrane-bound lytic murein transglycosylase D
MDKREKPMPQLFEQETKTTYRVRSGDYLGKVARQYGVRVSDIKKWNGLRSNNLTIGQRLKIYSHNSASSSASETSSNSTKASSSSVSTAVASTNAKTYKVRSGDSLWSISQKFSGISVDDIKKWNDISGNKLTVGTTLKISK